jgi:hypothetical protein
LESPYWSKIYAYEIHRVALSIVANVYAAYTILLYSPCITTRDGLLVFANTSPPPEEEK